MGDTIDEPREWLIRKDGYFYRPNCQGYTTRKIEAGRYTKHEADVEAAVEPWHMSAIHQDEVPDEPAVAKLEADLARLRAENEALRTERDNSRANSVSRGKKLIRLRNKIIEISNHIEHEGDRAYFGSTNHADELREIFLWLDGFKWDRVMAESDEDDLLSSVERLLARAAAAEAKAARLETALRHAIALAEAMLTNDPNEPISDAGHTLLEWWMAELEKLRAVLYGNLWDGSARSPKNPADDIKIIEEEIAF